MKIDERYEIRVMVVEDSSGTGVGDCYDNFTQFRMDYPESPYFFGFVVFDTETGLVPDECNDWNDTVDAALEDYWQNVMKG